MPYCFDGFLYRKFFDTIVVASNVRILRINIAEFKEKVKIKRNGVHPAYARARMMRTYIHIYTQIYLRKN